LVKRGFFVLKPVMRRFRACFAKKTGNCGQRPISLVSQLSKIPVRDERLGI
jgi:hypothetical protein